MSTYLAVENLTKTYGTHTVLNDVSLTLSAGQRVGLVGANGVGKTTLLTIITGQLEPDAGAVRVYPGVRVGYLEQIAPDAENHTLHSLIDRSLSVIRDLEARLRDLEQQMTSADGNTLDEVMTRYGELTERFEQMGGYDLDYRVDVVLDGLGVGHIPREQRFESLSGGEQARFRLALLLLESFDVLLLDEPTNHLDHASLDWLEGYLSAFRGALLVVSHDRHFLNRTVNQIVEIQEHDHRAKLYTGDYDAYLHAKRVERQQWETAYIRQQEKIQALRLAVKETARANSNYRTHTDNDKFIPKAKKATHDATVAKRVRAAEEKLRRIEADPIAVPPEPLRFVADFDPVTLHGDTPVVASGLTVRYGERAVLDNLTVTLGSGARVLLVGDNGAGKSTLLRVLAGELAPDAGAVQVNAGVRVGYLDQDQRSLDPAQTVFEAYAAGFDGTEQQLKATLLQSGLFRYDEIDRRLAEISIGMQRKLQIARLMAARVNVLLLDEPTNHISFDVWEAFEDALDDFPGVVVAATHDRRFMSRFGGVVWEVRDGTIVKHPNHEAYELAVLA